MNLGTVDFGPDAVVFTGYPYPGSRVHRQGVIPWSEVVEVGPKAAPPELRTADEVLFIHAGRKDDLCRAAEVHGVPIVDRVDVWDLLLEPFLDTTFKEDDQERTLSRLEQNGISRDEAQRIRDEVGKRMLAYNSILWDWTHLGMCDLFDAHRGLNERRFREFFVWAQEIARRGGVRPDEP